MKSWHGKAAVVTGGASGIGLAIARGLAARGVRIVLADIEQSALDVSVRALRSFGDSVEGFRMDVADFAQVEQLAAFCTATFGPTHLLFDGFRIVTLPGARAQLGSQSRAV